MEQFSQYVLGIVDHAGLPGLFIVLVLGNIGVPIGAELVVAAAGALVATGHLPSFWSAVAVAVAGELVGAWILYAVGFYGGRPFVDRYGRYIKLDRKKYDLLHAFYERHGAKTVFLCRFIPLVRGVASLPAGVSQMSKRAFTFYTGLGSLIFCGGLAWLGMAFGKHLDAIIPLLHRLTGAVVVGALACAALAVVLSRRAQRAKRGVN